MEKAKIINFSVEVKIEWECPSCGANHKIEYDASPYSSISEDPIDEICSACEDFFTIQI